MKKFKVGDKVVCEDMSIWGNGDDKILRFTGTIVYADDSSTPYLVDFGKDFNGHNGGAYSCRCGYVHPTETCWWCDDNELKLCEVVSSEDFTTPSGAKCIFIGTRLTIGYTYDEENNKYYVVKAVRNPKDQNDQDFAMRLIDQRLLVEKLDYQSEVLLAQYEDITDKQSKNYDDWMRAIADLKSLISKGVK